MQNGNYTGNIVINLYFILTKEIEDVKEEYKYLGFVITSNGSMTNRINIITKQGVKAWFAVQKYVRGFKQKTIHA